MKNYIEINVGALIGCYPNSRDNNIRLELEEIDWSFLLDIKPETIVRNSDMYEVLDCLDVDMLKEYIAERFGVNIE